MQINDKFEIVEFNTMIYLIFQRISKQFIQTLPIDLQVEAENSEHIYCNYIDSRLRYDSQKIDELRERSEYFLYYM